MRKQDIKPGVLYAWTRSREYGEPQPIVFLNTPADGELYRRPRRYGSSTGPVFTRDYTSSKPESGSGFASSPVGYPAVIGHSAAAAGLLPSFALAGFEAATSAHSDETELTVITSLAQVTGPYAEAVAGYQARRQAEREHRDRQTAAADDRHTRSKAAAAKLASAEIFSSTRDGEIVLSLENAEKLAALLVRVGLSDA